MGSFFYLSCLIPELQLLKFQSGSFFVFFADLSAYEKSCLALSEDVMDQWVLSYHQKDINP